MMSLASPSEISRRGLIGQALVASFLVTVPGAATAAGSSPIPLPVNLRITLDRPLETTASRKLVAGLTEAVSKIGGILPVSAAIWVHVYDFSAKGRGGKLI